MSLVGQVILYLRHGILPTKLLAPPVPVYPWDVEGAD